MNQIYYMLSLILEAIFENLCQSLFYPSWYVL